MSKIKIIVWGINDAIIRVVRNEIDTRKVEIIAFIDSDKAKQGTHIMGIPVVSFKEIVNYNTDFFLITALSAYEKIKQQLVDAGVSEQKVQVLVTEQLCDYCVGNIDNIDLDFVQQAYFEPAKMKNIIKKYQKIFQEYFNIMKYEDEEEEWFHKSNLISHACGGIVNSQKVPYSNSKEAFLYSMDKGFKVIECDVCGLDKGELILAHDYSRLWEAKEGKYTMMTVQELFFLLKDYADVSCLIDVKWNNYEEYAFCIKEIERYIKEICINESESNLLKKQIVLEVYDETTIKIAKEKKFNMIFTQYRNPDKNCFMNTVNICYRYGIKVIAIPVDWNRVCYKFLKTALDKKIQIYVFSTDSIEVYNVLRENGVKGIFTNYLTEKEVLNK